MQHREPVATSSGLNSPPPRARTQENTREGTHRHAKLSQLEQEKSPTPLGKATLCSFFFKLAIARSSLAPRSCRVHSGGGRSRLGGSPPPPPRTGFLQLLATKKKAKAKGRRPSTWFFVHGAFPEVKEESERHASERAEGSAECVCECVCVSGGGGCLLARPPRASRSCLQKRRLLEQRRVHAAAEELED